ncbi:MAG: ABC transporter substrate-binding protein [Thermoleophilaceae bacterium]|nr:ABC transporter substrate-binding protein [Thermoleophilaceae bacterium]
MARALVRTVLAAAVLATLGCGSDDGPGDAPAASGDGAFPARVKHKFGATTVPARPRRVVVVGLTEQDTVLELGYEPIATTEWYGDQPHAVWPWARPLLGDGRPVVLDASDGFDFERIAELRPDLIIGVNAGMRKPDYEKLSRLAPTIPAARGSTDYFSTWDEQVRLVSAALGKPEEGRALIEGVKDAYADAAAAHPEFRGKTATFSQNGFYDGLIYVYPAGLNTEFLTMLGFTINPKLTPLVKRPGEQVGISEERLEVLDADVIVFATEKPEDVDALEKVPTFGELKAVSENRAVYTDGTLAGAVYFMTPTSLRYALRRLTPQLEAAVAGEAPREVASAPQSG